MKLKKGYLFFALVIISTTSCTGFQDSEGGVTEVNLPSHISGVENLTVFPADTEPAHEIQLVRENTFGSSDQLLIGRMGDAVVDEDNRLFVPDYQSYVIHVFNPDGSHLRTIGREGSGPGEFKSIGILMLQSGELYVFDGQVKTIQSFSLETLEYLNTIYTIPQNTGEYEELRQVPAFRPEFVKIDGSFILDYYKIRNPYWEPDNPDEDGIRLLFLLSSDGMRLEKKIFEQPFSYLYSGYGLVPSVPYDNEPLITISSDGHIFSAMSNDFMISEYDPDGNYLKSFYYPFEKRDLTEDEAEAVIRNTSSEVAVERKLRALRDLGVPDSWPALNALHSDDEGRLWVSTVTDDDEAYEWWVLENSGELIGKVNLPRGEQFAEVKNGYLYTSTTDDVGLRQIIKYQISESTR